MVTYNNLKAEPGLLAARETRYLLGFAQGFSYKQVARDCGVSPNTVAGARKRILYKLKAMRMTEAITRAFLEGLIQQLAITLIVSLLVVAQITPFTSDQPMHRTPRTRLTRTFRGGRLRSHEDLLHVRDFA